MKAVYDDAFDYVPFEKMSMSHCGGSYKIKVMRDEVWFDRHDISSLLPQGLTHNAQAGSVTLRRYLADTAVTDRLGAGKVGLFA